MTGGQAETLEIDARVVLSKRVIAILNTGSGGCDAHSAGRLTEVFVEAGIVRAEVRSVNPDGLEDALKVAAATADVVVVLGGDGSIRAAAQECGKAGKFLVPLPGGTMNMLPHALYGDLPWDVALQNTLAAPRVLDVNGGVAEGQPFYCAAILGAPSLWADAREAFGAAIFSRPFGDRSRRSGDIRNRSTINLAIRHTVWPRPSP